MEISTIELPDFSRFQMNHKYDDMHSAKNEMHKLSNFISLPFSLPDKDRHSLALLQKANLLAQKSCLDTVHPCMYTKQHL